MQLRIIGIVMAFVAATYALSWGQDRDKNTSAPTQTTKDTAVAPKTVAEKPRQEQKPPQLASSQDSAAERAIREEAKRLIAEYNSKNAKNFAALFLPNADYEFDTGKILVGRAEIESYFADVFEKYPNAKAVYKETRIRLITPQIGTEEGLFGVTNLLDESESDEQVVITWILSDNHWRIASMREMTLKSKAGTAHNRLNQLAWLIGDWIDESHESVVNTSCRWSDDGNFLLRDFKVHVRGENVLSTTQRIGWDPLTQKIRSWFFDSNGGFGESIWSWTGEQWVIRVSSVREDGAIAASLDFLTPVSGDTYRWKSSHRIAGDEGLSDLDVLIVRQPPVPPKAGAAESAKSSSATTNRSNKN